MTANLWLSALLSIGPTFVPASGGIVAPALPARLSPIKRVVTTEPAIAITFDACATRTRGYGFDRPVFEILKREGVPATIFVSGRWVESHPMEMGELVLEGLIEFGDHSYDHPHMSRLRPAQIADEIDQTEAVLARFGKRGVAFRPPFGDWNQSVLTVVQDKQLPAVLWDVVSGDPSAKTTAAGMIREVLRRTRPGSIIIFHINGRERKTAEALPVIVRELRARGFRFVPLSELLSPPPTLPPTLALPLPAAVVSAQPFVTPVPASTSASIIDKAPEPGAPLP
jgi:peptidoglycan/xylan/chitin deacetylase (PgdA/CDA1 family)